MGLWDGLNETNLMNFSCKDSQSSCRSIHFKNLIEAIQIFVILPVYTRGELSKDSGPNSRDSPNIAFQVWPFCLLTYTSNPRPVNGLFGSDIQRVSPSLQGKMEN